MDKFLIMKHTISINNAEVNAKITIKLADDCKNGHEDFSIVGTFWEPETIRAGRNIISDGCSHDLIIKHFPQFEQFVLLHLKDHLGVPSYCVQNGFFVKEQEGAKGLAKFFDIPLWMAEKLSEAVDHNAFNYTMEMLKIDELWAAQARTAIEKLEEMTGEKFIPKGTKRQYTRLEGKERADFMEKLTSGWYTDEQIQNRERGEREALIKDLSNKERQVFEFYKIAHELKMELITKYPYKWRNWFVHVDQSTGNTTLMLSKSLYAKKFTAEEIKDIKAIAEKHNPRVKITVKDHD